MATTEQEIDGFAQFAKDQLRRGQTSSIDELFDLWRLQHPPADDALAIKASIRDMERGEIGRPFSQFAHEFRKKNNMPKPQ